MIRNLDTGLLRAFVAVAELGGMTAAAQQLHLTQAAISQQIRRLEEQLGQQLFDRGKRGLSRTAMGDRLYGPARAMLAQNDEIWAMMTRPEFEGEIRIGVPHDIVNAILPKALRRFDAAWPKVHVRLDCSNTPDLLVRMNQGELDLILTTEAGTPGHARRMVHDRLAWYGTLNGSAHCRKPLPVALGDENCAFRPIIRQALADAGLDWRLISDTAQAHAVDALIGADIAIGAGLASTLPPGFEILPEACGLPHLPAFYINLYLPRFGASEIAVEFARHLEDALSESAKLAA